MSVLLRILIDCNIIATLLLFSCDCAYSQYTGNNKSNWDISIEAQRQNIYLSEKLYESYRNETERNIQCLADLTKTIDQAKKHIASIQCPDISKDRLYERNRIEVNKLIDYSRKGYSCLYIKSLRLDYTYWNSVFQSTEYASAIRSQEAYQLYLRDRNQSNFVFNRIYVPWAKNGKGEFVDFQVIQECYQKNTTYQNMYINEFMYNGGFVGFSYMDASLYFSATPQYGSKSISSAEVTPEQLRVYIDLLNRFPEWYAIMVVEDYKQRIYRTINASGQSANPLWWKKG